MQSKPAGYLHAGVTEEFSLRLLKRKSNNARNLPATCASVNAGLTWLKYKIKLVTTVIILNDNIWKDSYFWTTHKEIEVEMILAVKRTT